MMSSEVESFDLKEENFFFFYSEAVDFVEENFMFSAPIKGLKLSGVSHCCGLSSKDLAFYGRFIEGFLSDYSK